MSSPTGGVSATMGPVGKDKARRGAVLHRAAPFASVGRSECSGLGH